MYPGGTKFFSCTGFFINFDDECQTILTSATLVRDPDGSNKIVEGLKVGASNYTVILVCPGYCLSIIVSFAD